MGSRQGEHILFRSTQIECTPKMCINSKLSHMGHLGDTVVNPPAVAEQRAMHEQSQIYTS